MIQSHVADAKSVWTKLLKEVQSFYIDSMGGK